MKLNRRNFLKLLGYSSIGLAASPKIDLDNDDFSFLENGLEYNLEEQLFFQDTKAPLLNNPDGDGFYWGLQGTNEHPVYEVQGFHNLTIENNLNNLDLKFLLTTRIPDQSLRRFISSKDFRIQGIIGHPNHSNRTIIFHRCRLLDIQTIDFRYLPEPSKLEILTRAFPNDKMSFNQKFMTILKENI